jgi:1-acyl-sn-glycerol-3-phosphate acyltransferase
MHVRRLVTIPGFAGAALLLTALLPVLLPISVTMTLLPAMRGALRTLLFVCGYLWCEVMGMVAAFAIWIRYRDQHEFMIANYGLQCWWANALKVLAERLFRLSFDISGANALDGAPALMLPRHASIADTIIPMVFYSIPKNVRLRYVLKNELLADPCIDIVGNRMPNLFVDRSGQDGDRARRGVAQLVAQLGDDEGVLMYPEGTRYSAARRTGMQLRYADVPELSAQLQRWECVLPPRLGGTLALLANNPGRDLVFCAHAGFEGSSRFRDLVNGAWLGTRTRIHFWRIPFAGIPSESDAAREFLFAQWDRMNATVRALAAGLPPPTAPLASAVAMPSRRSGAAASPRSDP